MMESPTKRTLRMASDLTALFLTVSIYSTYVDGSILIFLWKLAVSAMLQRGVASLAKRSGSVEMSGAGATSGLESSHSANENMLVELEDFYGANFISPTEHKSSLLRWLRAISLFGYPLLVHLFSFLSGPPLTNPTTPASTVGGLVSEERFHAIRAASLNAADSPEVLLRWQHVFETTKFWSFTAAPETVTWLTVAWIDAFSICVIYVILALLFVAAGGTLQNEWFVQVLPLRRGPRVDASADGSRRTPDNSPVHQSDVRLAVPSRE